MKKSTLKFMALAMFFMMGTFVMAQTQYEIKFQVDMTDADPFDPATDELFMSGTFADWAEPGSNADYKMTAQIENPMIYELTVTIDSGEVMYKYWRVIDGVPSWTDGDEWEGDPNRKIYIRDNRELMDIWGTKPQDVSFTVDMSDAAPFDPANDAVYISGDFASWWAEPGTMSPFMMSTEDDVFYTLTLTITPGTYGFKYFIVSGGVPSWSGGEWEGDPNRELVVDTLAVVVEDVWGDIEAGIFGEPNEFTYNMYPNPVVTVLNIGNTMDVSQVEVFDVTGKLVRTVEVASAQQITIDVAELQTGVYIINVKNDKGIQTSKFVKN